MKKEKFCKKALVLVSICISYLTGCYNSSEVFRYDNTKNDSLFVQREFGAKVLIRMNNGEEYSGELLRVRERTMILCCINKISEEYLSEYDYSIYALNNHEIRLMELRSENDLMLGIVFGGLAGAALGAAVGSGSGKKQEPSEGSFPAPAPDFGNAPEGCCIGGVIGALIGALIANSATTDYVVYEYANPEDYDFTQLNIYSRYGGYEPDYLKDIK